VLVICIFWLLSVFGSFVLKIHKSLNILIKFQSDDVYLEAQVQNMTAGPICLEKVQLESSQAFTGTSNYSN
jgi:trafficking protein particle complex subunit 13